MKPLNIKPIDLSKKTGQFKDLLDQEYNWPCQYMFKFIVPQEKKEEVSALFPEQSLSFRHSSRGSYTSVTATIEAASSEIVIATYEKASMIKGLMAL